MRVLAPLLPKPLEWHEERRKYLGASEVAAVLGLSPHSRPLDVWASKLGIAKPRESEAMDAGNALESGILALYGRRTGAELVAGDSTVHLLEPWLRATPDAIAGDVNVQAKAVGFQARHQWGPEDVGAEGVPEHYIVQVQIEMEVIGLSVTDIAALFGTELRVYRVERDPDLAAALVEEARDWWAQYVAPASPDIFPADGSTEAQRDRLRARWPKIGRPLLDAPESVIELAREYGVHRDAEKEAKAEKERVGLLLCDAIADAEGFKGEWGSATWRYRKGRASWKGIAEELRPSKELIAKHTPAPERQLDVRLRGDDDE